MKTTRIVHVFFGITFIVFFCHCVPQEITLWGDLGGIVTDSETNEPVPEAVAKLYQSNSRIDTTITANDGYYLFSNLDPGGYEIKLSKATYEETTKDASVTPAGRAEINFELTKAPFISFSDSHLDFGLDSVNKSFTISNIGSGTLRYSLSTSQDWITVDPKEGDVSAETDTIHVTIDKTGLSYKRIQELISITSYPGDDPQYDVVGVWANGVADDYGNYYGIVTIGTQTWLAENLNVGTMIQVGVGTESTDNGIIEKYCYENSSENCDIYGGLYSWTEAMNYSFPDSTYLEVGAVGGYEYISQGICPAGWRIPTWTEWFNMHIYLGYPSDVSGKMKATGTIEGGDGLWFAPNTGATNESGFSAIPAGEIWDDKSRWKGEQALFSTSFKYETLGITYHWIFGYSWDPLSWPNTSGDSGAPNRGKYSIRCIKDTE